MKKSALHFKIAAWSIKNPGRTYGAIGGLVVLLVAASVFTTSLLGQKQGPGAVKAIPVNSAVADSFERANWTITARQSVDGRQCITYRHSTNGTRLTSCYIQDGKDWIFQQSF